MKKSEFTFKPLKGRWFRCNQTGEHTRNPKALRHKLESAKYPRQREEKGNSNGQKKTTVIARKFYEQGDWFTRCPNCNAKIRISNGHTLVRCRKCQKEFSVG